MWNDMGGDSWELAVAPDGGTPETANVMPCSNTMFTVQGLDTGRWHVAWVRSVCGTDSVIYSDWSDSVRFYVPGDGQQGTEGIGNTADRYTYIMPNPATERVTVASSFRIGQVELYTLNGQRVLQQRVDGMSTVLDVSGLAAGTYILRVHTHNGVSNKKLVVKGA